MSGTLSLAKFGHVNRHVSAVACQEAAERLLALPLLVHTRLTLSHDDHIVALRSHIRIKVRSATTDQLNNSELSADAERWLCSWVPTEALNLGRGDSRARC